MSSGRLWTEEQFNCPVCLDLPTDPVTIPCGHSYCMDCIADHWDSEEQKTGTCSCPECRQTFSPRPQLCRNTMLAEAVEQLRSGNLSSSARESIRNARQAAKSAQSKARQSAPKPKRLPASAVPCDRCQEPRAAVKTCLVCLASFCPTHLKPHQTQANLKNHELIGPTADLTQKICPEHKYLQEFYCRSCQTYVCWLCTSNQHKGHECVSTQTERVEKQKTLTAVQTENQQRLQERERELKDMKKVLETLKRSSDTVKEEAETVLSELQRSVQRMLELIQDVMMSSGQEKLTEAQEVVDKLEAEIKQLKKKDAELKDLVKSQDNIHFLKTYHCLCSPEVSELGGVTANVEASFDSVRSVVLDLREKVENMCNQELDKINKTVFNTTAFTVTDRQSGQKGLLKLFSGLGGKAANSRTQGPPPLPSVSARGPGPAARPQDRSRNGSQAQRGTSSPRPRTSQAREETEQDGWSVSSLTLRERQRQRREAREPERETESSSRSRSRQSRNTDDDQAETRSVRPLRPQAGERGEDRQQADNWSLSSIRPRDRQKTEERETANGDLTSSQRSQHTPARQQAQRQSDRWSLSSLLPRNRKKRQESVREATPTVQEEVESQNPASANPFLSAGATEVNPGLFLDSPTDFSGPVFPTLREINIDSIQAPEPRTRDEFLQYACDLTLDPNTAHRRLAVTEGETKATLQATSQPYPDCPQRFDGWTQVLCLQPLSSAQCYWEVEWRGRGSSVGVVSGTMPRKGADAKAGLGYNSQSWSLELSDMCCAAMHANQKEEIPVIYCPRVGVFLDRDAGKLTFYSVDDSLVPLHTFHGSFPQPLFAAFGVGSGVGVGLDFAMGQFNSTSDSIKICPL
ncbi:E3 ubiquitin/ISG15 ligase TRIM25 [Pygocentrus nattereri]|uniref:Tripartite motif containing 25, like n=1 Tax=Pygocentrus nattereri TaxID=42514 RepID=A0AAR2KQD6_PYGNA|nr:E3 ubiquitin/ISG15 ligase TRIM25 [Pygocentrus nattereri]XP_017559150.2 E3 ubiquitin/ISG15 ligase TRIM25 [Pygocentrus nattereri]XP_017559152.2 E3 ubiquitin/ISG15 ligase TRIM25 [Pygocentrus nattereri]XP_037392391.1 E3 ubiquitin/ISG15 ligase TRIM25 [Pygocentrus nattereri]